MAQTIKSERQKLLAFCKQFNANEVALHTAYTRAVGADGDPPTDPITPKSIKFTVKFTSYGWKWTVRCGKKALAGYAASAKTYEKAMAKVLNYQRKYIREWTKEGLNKP